MGPVRVWNGATPKKWGTLTCLVRNPGMPEELFALGCAHVLAPLGDVPEAATFGQPIFSDLGEEGRQQEVGTLYDWLPIRFGGDERNVADAAIFMVDRNRAQAVRDCAVNLVAVAGPVTNQSSFTVHGAATRAQRRAVVRESFVARKLDYTLASGVQRRALLEPVLVSDLVTQGGDSGALVMDDAGRGMGMVLGGNAIQGESYYCPLVTVLAALQVELLGSASAPAAPLAAAAPPSHPPEVDDRAEAVDILARTLWGEARGEPERGRRAVAAVVVNRALRQRRGWGLTVQAVCRKPWQFSCWNANDPNLEKLLRVDTRDADFVACLNIAKEGVAGINPDETAGATHYHHHAILPSWAHGKRPSARIGRHLFYNNID